MKSFEEYVAWVLLVNGIIGLLVLSFIELGWSPPEFLGQVLMFIAFAPTLFTTFLGIILNTLGFPLVAPGADIIFALASAVCVGLGLFGIWKIQQSSKEKLPSPEECDRELDEVERLHRERGKQP
jgi:membrane-bound ClpP family serine protease